MKKLVTFLLVCICFSLTSPFLFAKPGYDELKAREEKVGDKLWECDKKARMFGDIVDSVAVGRHQIQALRKDIAELEDKLNFYIEWERKEPGTYSNYKQKVKEIQESIKQKRDRLDKFLAGGLKTYEYGYGHLLSLTDEQLRELYEKEKNKCEPLRREYNEIRAQTEVYEREAEIEDIARKFEEYREQLSEEEKRNLDLYLNDWNKKFDEERERQYGQKKSEKPENNPEDDLTKQKELKKRAQNLEDLTRDLLEIDYSKVDFENELPEHQQKYKDELNKRAGNLENLVKDIGSDFEDSGELEFKTGKEEKQHSGFEDSGELQLELMAAQNEANIFRCKELAVRFNAASTPESKRSILQQATDCSWYGQGFAILGDLEAASNQPEQTYQQVPQGAGATAGSITGNTFYNPFALPVDLPQNTINNPPIFQGLNPVDYSKKGTKKKQPEVKKQKQPTNITKSPPKKPKPPKNEINGGCGPYGTRGPDGYCHASGS